MEINETRFRVRYAETDQMGMTHHSSYFPWFEVGRTEYMRERGFPYSRLEAMGLGLPLVEATCRYLRTTRYDDIVAVRTCLREVSRVRIAFEYEVWVLPDESAPPGVTTVPTPQKVAEGYTVHAFVNSAGKPVHLSRQSEVWQALSGLSLSSPQASQTGQAPAAAPEV